MEKKNSNSNSSYNSGYFDAVHFNSFNTKLVEGSDAFESYLQGWCDGKSSQFKVNESH